MLKSRIGLIVILILIGLLVILLYSAKGKTNSKKILTARSISSPSPTQVYTPSVTPVIQSISVTPNNSDLYLVEKVIDGDTITVMMNGHNETIRLIGINTPESVDPRKSVECFGLEASNKAKELLNGHKVALEEDISQGNRDKYNRLLRYVFRDDGLFFNLWMIQNGYAYEYTYNTPYKYSEEFRNAQQVAQDKNTGLWGVECSKEVSSASTKKSPQQTSQITKDLDCKDFSSQKDAQDFFVEQGGPAKDPNKLDSDGDGVVCESLP